MRENVYKKSNTPHRERERERDREIVKENKEICIKVMANYNAKLKRYFAHKYYDYMVNVLIVLVGKCM